MESFNLNIIPGKTRPVCHASQFDTGRVIRVNLFEDANIYTLSGSEEVSLSVRKPDGNVVTVEIENTGDSFVEIVTTEQMTACAGSNLCELKIEDDGKVIGSMNFILETEQDPLEGGIESESSIYNLETQVSGMVTDAVADQYDSNAVIFDQTPTAGHGNGYAVTSEGIKSAIDNAVGSLSTEIEGLSTNVDSLTSEVSALDVTVQAKQNANDAALATTSKNVVGAINEVNTKVGTKQDNLNKGQISAVNLNTLNTNGVYYLAGVSSANNAPINDCWGLMEVMAAVIIIQRVTQVGPSGVGANVYERLFISGNWTAWKKITRTLQSV